MVVVVEELVGMRSDGDNWMRGEICRRGVVVLIGIVGMKLVCSLVIWGGVGGGDA